MKYQDTPMGKAMEIAIRIGLPSPEEDMHEEGEESDEMYEHNTNNVKLAPAEAMYVESMYEIVSKYGKLADNDDNGIYVGYMSPSENDNKSIGVKCSNCAFWCPEMMGCHIIVEQAEPEGLCRLAAIGEGLVNGDRK